VEVNDFGAMVTALSALGKLTDDWGGKIADCGISRH